METPVSADGVRQLLLALNGGTVILSDSGGHHVEGVVDAQREARIVHHNSLLRIQCRGRTTIRLAVPAGLDLKFRGRGSDVTAGVTLGNASVATGPGDVRLDAVAGLLEVMTDAGDIDVVNTGRQARIRSGSGSVMIGTATGRIDVRTGSGDITVASNQAEASLVSGSGDITVGVPTGQATWLDLRSWTGSVDVSLDERDSPGDGEQARVKAATTSGDVRIVQA